MEVESEESRSLGSPVGDVGGKEGVHLTLLAFHKILGSVFNTTALPWMEETISVTEQRAGW